MVNCTSCDQINNESVDVCVNCGAAMPRYDEVCGMPLLASECADQVLSMRYVVLAEISRGQNGCLYKAEDAFDGSIVVIKAMPLSVKLTDKQIQQLKTSTETITSLSPKSAKGLKGFGVSGKVRYFVYDADSENISENNQALQQLQDELENERASQQKIRIELQQYIEQLQSLKVQLEKDKQTHSRIISQSAKQRLAQQEHYEGVIADLKSAIDIHKTKIDIAKSSYEQQIEQLSSNLKNNTNNSQEELNLAKINISDLQKQHQQVIEINSQKCRDYEDRLKQLQDQLTEQKALYEQKYNNEIETINSKDNLSEELQQQIEKLNKALSLKEDKLEQFASQIEKLLKKESNLIVQIESKQIQYEQQIEQLKLSIQQKDEQASKQIAQYSEQLESVQLKNDLLTQSLKATEQKLEQANHTIEQSCENSSESIEIVKAKARRKNAEYAEQLEKAQWKIKALTVEVDRLLNKSIQHAQPSREITPKYRFPSAFTASALAASIMALIGISYMAVNSEKALSSQDGQQQQIVKLAAEYDTLGQQKNDLLQSKTETDNESISESVFEQEIKRLDDYYISTLSQETSRIYIKAVQKGDVGAMYELGKAYMDGAGIEQNTKKAVLWLSKAAENQNDNAMLELGNIYYYGNGVEQNKQKAFGYYEKASQLGNAVAMYNMGSFYQEDAVTQAIEYYQNAAKAGSTKAMNQLAQIYYLGTFVRQDLKKSFEYYELSAKNGDTKAMYNLASFYQAGIAVDKDVRTAMLWLVEAARAGDADSMYQLGFMFENGSGIEQDMEKAVYWYQTAAASGHQKASQKLIDLERASS